MSWISSDLHFIVSCPPGSHLSVSSRFFFPFPNWTLSPWLFCQTVVSISHPNVSCPSAFQTVPLFQSFVFSWPSYRSVWPPFLHRLTPSIKYSRYREVLSPYWCDVTQRPWNWSLYFHLSSYNYPNTSHVNLALMYIYHLLLHSSVFTARLLISYPFTPISLSLICIFNFVIVFLFRFCSQWTTLEK